MAVEKLPSPELNPGGARSGTREGNADSGTAPGTPSLPNGPAGDGVTPDADDLAAPRDYRRLVAGPGEPGGTWDAATSRGWDH